MNKNKTLALGLIALVAIGGTTALQVEIEDPVQALANIGCSTMTSWMLGSVCTPDPTNYDVVKDQTATIKTSIHGNAATIQQNRNQTTQNSRAQLNQSFGISMAQAKAASFEGIKNGTTLSRTQTKALKQINEFYAEIEKQNIKRRNTEVKSFMNALKTIRQDSDINEFTTYNCDGTIKNKGVIDVVTSDKITDDARDYADRPPIRKNIVKINSVELVNESVQLKNGSTTTAYGLKANVTRKTDENCGVGDTETISGYLYNPQISGTSLLYNEKIDVRDGSLQDPVPYLNDLKWGKVDSRLESNYDRAIDNTQPTIETIYNKYTAGELNDTDLQLGPLETLKTASTNYESTGFYDYRTLSLEQMGYATNETLAFNVSYDGEEARQGQIFLPDSFNKDLETNRTYDLNGENVRVIYQKPNGEAVRETIQRNFTINRMTNTETGETVNTTSAQPVRWYTGNASNLIDQFERVQDLKDEKTDSGGGFFGGGGSGPGPFGLSWTETGFILGLVALIAFGARGGN